MSLQIINSGVRKDERFCTSNSRNILKKDRSLFGYSQVINSGSQAILANTRTQLVNDATGAETFSTETLWNPVNNRINLQDAKVGDVIDLNVIVGAMLSGLIGMRMQLDFSPALDGSQVIGSTIANLIFSAGIIVESSQFDFSFTVTQPMKDNGIGIMVTSSVAIPLLNSRIMMIRLFSET